MKLYSIWAAHFLKQKMATATLTEKVETFVNKIEFAATKPEILSKIRPITNNYISVLYIYLPNFPKAESLVKALSRNFRAIDVIWYDPNLAAILLVGCGAKGVKVIEGRLSDKKTGIPRIFDRLINEGIINYLTERQKEYVVSSNTYSSSMPLDNFLQEVKNRITGKPIHI